MASDQNTNWWGESQLDVDRTDLWAIGNLDLWIHRAEAEWRLAHRWVDDAEHQSWRREGNVEFPDDQVAGERFAVRQTGGTVRLRARTADRAVVARPRTPLRVPSGHEARILVSSPLWVEISVGAESTFLFELPTRRLSDTWFGPSTREGEIAYALKTNARTSAENLPTLPYRFMTPVVIENRADDTLVVERLNLPVPHLSLYDKGGALWSESVRMVRTLSGDLAELDVRPGPPAEAIDADDLGEAREQMRKDHLFRAFSSILRFGENES